MTEKTGSNQHRCVRVAALAALLAAASAMAQAPSKDGGSSPSTSTSLTPAKPARALPDMETISVDFPGGTAKQYVEAVRRASRSNKINVVMPKETEEIPIPALSLRDVSPHTALEAIKYAATDDGAQFGIAVISKGDEGSATFAIQRVLMRSQQPNITPPPPPPVWTGSRVFSIRDLVEPPAGLPPEAGAALTTETVLSAVKAMAEIDMRTKTAPPEFMLHQESMLLIVRGTNDQLQSVQSVLGELRGSLVDKRDAAKRLAQQTHAARLEKVEMEATLAQARQQAVAADDEFTRAMASFDRINKQLAAGSASKVEQENAESALATARTMREQAMIALRAMEDRAAILKARTEAGGGGESERVVVVTYDVRDMKDYKEDVIGLCTAVAKLSRGKIQLQATRDDESGTVAVTALPAEHRVLVRALNLMRRAKANEPKLPGLDAEDLIRKGNPK